MKSNLWLTYIAFYVAFTAWNIWRVPGHVFISVTDIIQMSMLVGIVGLALNRKIFGHALWKIVSIVGGLLLIHSRIVMPFIYTTNDIGWEQVAIIQLFSLPTIPIFIGLYIYA